MIHYALGTSTFQELETRDFTASRQHALYDDFDTAYGVALSLTGRLRAILDDLRDAKRADGICIDVWPVDMADDGTRKDYAIRLSIELVPGRRPVFWFDEECHDNGCPRLETYDEDDL